MEESAFSFCFFILIFWRGEMIFKKSLDFRPRFHIRCRVIIDIAFCGYDVVGVA